MPLLRRTLHLVSDSTGETVLAAVTAAASQYPALQPETRLHPFVRNMTAVETALSAMADSPGAVFYTVADSRIRQALREGIARLGLPACDVLAPVFDLLGSIGVGEPAERPGRQYRVDRSYLDRVAAIEFAIAQDDGIAPDRLMAADVILIGVSRTSKTPTCIYLGYQGIRAANLPLVPGAEPPPALMAAREAGVPVIGLTASPQRLAQIRQQRLNGLDTRAAPDYADLDRIREEVTEARMFFERHAIPVIDVTRRSIEETAAQIRQMIARRTPAARGPHS
ncbi:MAG: putative pyruvate, phosphate dikinase regulatory protein [Paracoccaceae bacterium]|nr:MAG: kinase/pyrophosphorylase [Alphaproteobacteria bacterium]GIX12274.1 MAG: putative pyruvate, phosphate dikinase regulatory protein [Paracoccaceae bacterium]